MRGMRNIKQENLAVSKNFKDVTVRNKMINNLHRGEREKKAKKDVLDSPSFKDSPTVSPDSWHMSTTCKTYEKYRPHQVCTMEQTNGQTNLYRQIHSLAIWVYVGPDYNFHVCYPIKHSGLPITESWRSNDNTSKLGLSDPIQMLLKF